jgi:hypothetical protein
MRTTTELFDFSTTSRWGSDVDKEIDAEVLLYLLTPKKSVPYYRDMGTNLVRSENRPLNVPAAVRMGVEVVESIQQYNDDHDISADERRVSVPFEEIDFDDEQQRIGNFGITVKYTSLRNVQESKAVSF